MENEGGLDAARALLVVELRGFTASSIDLAKELESIGVSVERVRAGAREVVDGLLADVAASVAPTTSIDIGGDTWHFTFGTMLAAVQFGVTFLTRSRSIAVKEGLYYLKPSVGIGWGEPTVQEGRFLDNDSIATYRAADGGRAFVLHVVGDKAIARAGALPDVTLLDPKGRIAEDSTIGTVKAIDWQRYPQAELAPLADREKVQLADLLLDTEVLYSDTAEESLDRVAERQRAASEVLVFGGPASLESPMFIRYVGTAARGGDI